MQKIYLIRHGQTYFNIEGRIAGQIETNLTEIGKKQALDCALNLKNNNVKFDAILCSTLQRAKDTASIIASIIPSPIVENDDCKEFSNGIFEGIKAEDLQKKVFNPPYETSCFKFENGTDLWAAYSSFDPKYDTISYPEGETKAHARNRFMNAIENYIKENPDIQNLAVVAHGAVIRFLLSKVCPETLKEKIKNAETRIIYYDSKKGFFV